MPPLIKVGPCHDIFINLASRLVNHMLFISVCEKTLDFRGTNWNNDMGTSQLLFISLGFTASDWGKSGTNGGVVNQKSAFPIKPYLLSCSCWVKLSLWFVHIISGKQVPKHDLRAGLHHVAPPENTFRLHIVGNRSRQAHPSVPY